MEAVITIRLSERERVICWDELGQAGTVRDAKSVFFQREAFLRPVRGPFL
jgi:hypothetical protein